MNSMGMITLIWKRVIQVNLYSLVNFNSEPFFCMVTFFSGGRRGSSNRSQQDFEWDDGIMSDRDLLGHQDNFRGGQGGKRGGYDRDGPY